MKGVKVYLWFITTALWILAGMSVLIAIAAINQAAAIEQMLELSRKQYEDNQAMTARVVEMLDAEPDAPEPTAAISQADALDVLRESLRQDALRKEAGRQ